MNTWLPFFTIASTSLLMLVHLSLMIVMRYQRPWDRPQRAMFAFIATKVVIWSLVLEDTVSTMVSHGLVETYPLRYVLTFIAMDVASIWLLYELDRRYRRGKEG